jgi:thiamine biosynthesis lipoprotein
MDAQTEGFEVGDHVYVYHYYDGEKSEENKVIVNQTGIVESVLRDEEDESVILSVTLNVGESTITIDRNDAYKKEISKAIYDQAILDIDALDFSENSISLEEEQSKYYVTFSGEDIKVDLGAISKGYATQKVYEYINALDIKNYSISSGTSSIVLGENQNRAEENFVFYVSLANPYQTEILDKDTYGTVKVKNLSVTTSGNYEQYVLYQGQRYHHIVSPFEKMPVQYYHTITILGEDAGLLDALSTALFSMPPEEMSAWLTEYQETLDIEVIRFNQDLTVDTFLLDTEFEEH